MSFYAPFVFIAIECHAISVYTHYTSNHICAIVVTIDQWGFESIGVETPGVAARLHANYLADSEAINVSVSHLA